MKKNVIVLGTIIMIAIVMALIYNSTIEHTYVKEGRVVSHHINDDSIIVRTIDGNEWLLFDEFAYAGEELFVKFSDNKTPNVIEDDVIIQITPKQIKSNSGKFI